MEQRNPLLQPDNGEGGMGYRAYIHKTPLLPFEKELIKTVGLTEEEYRYFAAQAIKRAKPRPAAYDHIPNIVAGAEFTVAKFLTQLAIGLAIGYVTYLLTPKPKQSKFERRSLADINQAGRFNPTFGFDTAQELATYGEAVPIIFGKYDETTKTGGILASPKLVWSRLFSWGTQQSVKQLWVLGEQGYEDGQGPDGIARPDLEGIFIGNGALDAIYESAFAFYWKRNNSLQPNRIRADNFHFGTRGTPSSGDPETDDDIFSCPTLNSDREPGFCAAHSLSNNAEFGCYAPIPNGSIYRVNWRIITWSKRDPGKDDPGNIAEGHVIKISGRTGWKTGHRNSERWNGMPGVGRNYSRRMGITKLRRSNGTEVTCSDTERIKTVEAAKGDQIYFTITGGNQKIPADIYSDGRVKVDDINSAVDGMREKADDQLMLGEIFQIGRTYWQVSHRDITRWNAEDSLTQTVTLECIDDDPIDNTPNEIGIVSNYVINPPRHYISDSLEDVPSPGPGFFPLLRVSKAYVRNTRECEVVELGLKSRVYQQLNGLCELQGLPTPDELGALWRGDGKNGGGMESGTTTAFIKRASSFVVLVRRAGTDEDGNAYEWDQLPLTFVVVGNKAIDQYNWIRIKHPEKGSYEYQVKPKTGANMIRNNENKQFIQLSGASGQLISKSCPTPNHGTFHVTTKGEIKLRKELTINKEFINKPIITTSSGTTTKPSAVSILERLPVNNGSKLKRITGLQWVENAGQPSHSERPGGRHGAFFWEIFGSADSDPTPEGQTTSKWVKESVGGKELNIKYVVQKQSAAGNFSGESYRWESTTYLPNTGYHVRPPGGEWNVNDELTICRTLSSGNPFKARSGYPDLTQGCVRLEVTSTTDDDHTLGKAHALRWELFGDPSTLPVGHEKTITISDLTGLKLQMTSKVFAHDGSTWPGVPNSWGAEYNITVVQDSGTASTWNKEDTVNYEKTVSSNNPFRISGTKVGYTFKIDDLVTVLGTFSATGDRIFEGQSQLADISNYGDLVRKSNDSSPEHAISYVNEMLDNNVDPDYDKLTIGGLALKASRNYSSLDQVRVWLSEGLHVKHLHPDDNNSVGASNLLTDLVYYLLTDGVGGAGRLLNMTPDDSNLINVADLQATSRFLRSQNLFYNGAITEALNVRQFISDIAPNFLCNFVLSDGKFSLRPALPVTSTGQISTGSVEIKQLFTGGNILEDSFEVNYVGAEERRMFKAVMRWREEKKNALAKERTLTVRLNNGSDLDPPESFDLTGFCTSEEHAKWVAKYFLSVRHRITHSVSFKTTPYGLDLAPGDLVKVNTEASPYNAANNGTISASGVLTSVTALSNGQYSILYYKTASDEITTGTMTVSDGKVLESVFFDSVFTVQSVTNSQNVYRIEQLTLGEDHTVDIIASEFPCDDNLSSLIAQDVTNDSHYTFGI